MKKILNHKFFNRPTAIVARELLGKYLVHRHYSLIRTNKKIVKKCKDVAVVITEMEAYDGFKDKASQAFRGKTEHNKIMFGEAGTIYVYFTYGMHWMLNIVTGPKDYPAAVLIRGAGEYDGPAKLTKALKIDKRLNNKTLGKKTGLWIEERGMKILPRQIKKATRVGIRYAAEWANKKYRFILKKEL